MSLKLKYIALDINEINFLSKVITDKMKANKQTESTRIILRTIKQKICK
jgi:hypothetical protein